MLTSQSLVTLLTVSRIVNVRWSIAVLAVLLCIVLTTWSDIGLRIKYAYEDISFAFNSTAQQAFEYGERHFSSKIPNEYDIDRAEYFFKVARRMNPTIPYVNHELARVAFLRGDFTIAMIHINNQIALWGDKAPNSYYVRGLIEGYIGDYAASAKDYDRFLKLSPPNWAGSNDYVWVLLKAQRFQDAADATTEALVLYPGNPWLLNSHAIALYELGRYDEALVAAQEAQAAVATLTEEDWLNAYPGNDPKIADEGLSTFRSAVTINLQLIEAAEASSTRL